MSVRIEQPEFGYGSYEMRGRTIEPMPLHSKWYVHGVAPLGLAPNEEVLHGVLYVSHVEADGRVWLKWGIMQQARCNTPEWWQRFCVKFEGMPVKCLCMNETGPWYLDGGVPDGGCLLCKGTGKVNE